MAGRPALRRATPSRVLVAGIVSATIALAGCKGKAATPSATDPAAVPVETAPAPAADPVAGAASATTLFEAPTYTVEAGDTIGRIATKLGVPAQKLIDANGLAKPDRISVGTKLRVPRGAKVTTGGSSAAGPTTTTG